MPPQATLTLDLRKVASAGTAVLRKSSPRPYPAIAVATTRREARYVDACSASTSQIGWPSCRRFCAHPIDVLIVRETNGGAVIEPRSATGTPRRTVVNLFLVP